MFSYYLSALLLFHKGIYLNWVRGEISVFLIFFVVTLYHYMQRELEFKKLYKKADIRLNRLATLGEMSAEKIHELKNPLNSMRINAQALSRKFQQESIDYERASILIEEIDRLNTIITEYLSFSREKTGKAGEIDVNEVIRKSCELLKPELIGKNISLELKLSPNLPPILADRGELQQVILNLTLNGIQASKEGGWVRISTSMDPKSGVVIMVEDSGPGVPKHLQERIFYPFFTTKENGTGLGLPVSRRIVEAYGGEIRLVQGEGGACFCIQFPSCKGGGNGKRENFNNR
jgi:signal transduction histidine kinase